jgi:hypothetical protein
MLGCRAATARDRSLTRRHRMQRISVKRTRDKASEHQQHAGHDQKIRKRERYSGNHNSRK